MPYTVFPNTVSLNRPTEYREENSEKKINNAANIKRKAELAQKEENVKTKHSLKV